VLVNLVCEDGLLHLGGLGLFFELFCELASVRKNEFARVVVANGCSVRSLEAVVDFVLNLAHQFELCRDCDRLGLLDGSH
jgi:hypothetical protein